MPYTIVEKDGQYCVALESNPSEIFGCHNSRDQAVDQIAAIEASEGKAIGREYEDYIVTFDGTDLENEFFTKNTNFWLEYIKPRMIIFNHFLSAHPLGMHIKNSRLEYEEVPLEYYIVGEIKNLSIDDVGIKARYVLYEKLPAFVTDKFDLWNSQLEEEHSYWLEIVRKWKEEGKLAFSSDAIKQLSLREKTDDGRNHIKSWGMAYVSMTHIPAEPRNNSKVNELVTDGQPKSDRRQDNSKGVSVNSSDRTITYDDSESESDNSVSNQFKSSEVKMPKKDETKKALPINPEQEDKEEEMEPKMERPLDGDKMGPDISEENVKMEGVEEEEVEPKQEPTYELESEAVENERVDMTDIAQMLAELIAMLKVEQDKASDVPSADDKEEAMVTAESQEDTVDNTYKAIEEDVKQVSHLLKEVQENRNRGAGKYAVEDKEEKKEMKNVNINTSGFGRRDDDQNKFVKAIRLMRDKPSNMGSELKALGLIPASSGGYTTMVEQSNELIDLLLARSIFMRGGEAERLVDLMPMQSDTLTVPVLSSGGTAYWVGENSSITTTDPTFEQRTLVAKKLAMLIPVSNELLADNSVQLENKLRETMVRIMMNSVDQAILFGAGIGSEPLGVRNASGVTLTALNAAPTYADLVGAVQRLESANVELDESVAWIFNPRDKATLRKIEDTAGHLIWTDTQYIPQTGASMPNSYLLGHKWVSSTNAALGVGANTATEGDIYLARWDDVIVGLRNDVEIQVSDVAGTAFQNDQTWIRAIMRMDVAVKHPESIEILTDVQA